MGMIGTPWLYSSTYKKPAKGMALWYAPRTHRFVILFSAGISSPIGGGGACFVFSMQTHRRKNTWHASPPHDHDHEYLWEHVPDRQTTVHIKRRFQRFCRTCAQNMANKHAFKEINRRGTSVQQLTCNIDLSCSFYCLFFSFVLVELEGEVLGEKFWKSAKKCENFWNDFAL